MKSSHALSEIGKASAVGEATEKTRKIVAHQRSWWFSAKGVTTVIAAIAAAVVTVLAAIHSGGCS